MWSFTKKEALDRLNRALEEDKLVLATYWTEDDFQDLAGKNLEVHLSREEVRRAMIITVNRYDANIGINWDVIEEAVNHVLQQREA